MNPGLDQNGLLPAGGIRVQLAQEGKDRRETLSRFVQAAVLKIGAGLRPRLEKRRCLSLRQAQLQECIGIRRRCLLARGRLPAQASLAGQHRQQQNRQQNSLDKSPARRRARNEMKRSSTIVAVTAYGTAACVCWGRTWGAARSLRECDDRGKDQSLGALRDQPTLLKVRNEILQSPPQLRELRKLR